MEKIIIENRIDDMGIRKAMEYVSHVIEMGRISETGSGKQYCFHTTFKNGVAVSAFKNKGSDRFVLTRRM